MRFQIENVSLNKVMNYFRIIATKIFLPAILISISGIAAVGLDAVSIKNYFVFSRDREQNTPKEIGRIAVFSDGTLAIADASSRRVILRRNDGQSKSISVRPAALATNGNILYVAESKCIRKFLNDGTELPMLIDDSILNFSSITGLAIDNAGNIYASDYGRDVVFVISPDGLPLTVIGKDAKDEAELSNPSDVAVDVSGNVFIADRGNKRIAIYTSGGRYRGQIAEINNPSALTVDTAGIIYVADAKENRVLRFSFPNHPQGAFGTRGKDRGQFRDIVDLKIGVDGLLRIADASNRSIHELFWPATEIPKEKPEYILSARWIGVHPNKAEPIGCDALGRLVVAKEERVSVLDEKMNEVAVINQRMKTPSAAVVDAKSRLYVAEKGKGEIKVFDESLNELFSFGKGSRVIFFRGGPGKLIAPSALAISQKGIIAIVDKEKVELFSPDGTYMTSVGANGDKPGEFEKPVGAAFDAEENIFIADAKNGRLLKYDQSGNYSGIMAEGVEPVALKSDNSGRLYLLDEAGPCIRIYSSNLMPLLEIGTDGIGKGGLRRANAMVVENNRIFLSRRDGIIEIALDLPATPPKEIFVSPEMRSAKLSWINPNQNSSSYEIIIDSSSAALTSETECTVSSLDEEKEYEVKVFGINEFGRRGYEFARAIFRTSELILPVPEDIQIGFTHDLKGINISWRCESQAFVADYIVEGAEDVRYNTLTKIQSNSCTIPFGISKRYRIRAVADNGKVGNASIETIHFAAEGRSALELGMYSLAFERLSRAVLQEPDNAAVWRWLGLAGEKLERYRESMDAYEHAQKLNSQDTEALIGLARVALLKGDSIAATNALRSIQVNFKDAEYLYVAGLVSLMNSEFDTAVQLLTSAVAIKPAAEHRDALRRAEEARRLFGENRPRLEIISFQMEPIFPILYKTYFSKPIGFAEIVNSGREPLERIRVSAFIKNAMDFPSDSVIIRIEPGETILIPIRVELSNSVLGITENETKQIELKLTYFRFGDPVEVRKTEQVRIYARTSLTWEDPSRIAGFVTHRSPVVAEFARNISAYSNELKFDANLPQRLAQILRNALIEFGLKYQSDPLAPYSKVSEEHGAIDSVQLPEETLRNKAGDCDDLVVLYSALLENLGIRTMIADLPGHILLLIDSEMPPEAEELISEKGNCVEHGGSIWIPIETTLFSGTFSDAVKASSEMLKKYKAHPSEIRFVEIASAWEIFPPVTTMPTEWRASLPSKDKIIARSLTDDLKARTKMAEALEKNLVIGNPSDSTSFNKLGVLFARFGLLDRAEAYFMRDGISAAALNNIGNVALLRGDRDTAISYFERALQLTSDEGIRKNLDKAKGAGR